MTLNIDFEKFSAHVRLLEIIWLFETRFNDVAPYNKKAKLSKRMIYTCIYILFWYLTFILHCFTNIFEPYRQEIPKASQATPDCRGALRWRTLGDGCGRTRGIARFHTGTGMGARQTGASSASHAAHLHQGMGVASVVVIRRLKKSIFHMHRMSPRRRKTGDRIYSLKFVGRVISILAKKI